MKAIQEYSNAFKSKCDILLECANLLGTSNADKLRALAIKASKKAIDLYPLQNPELPGAYASKGNALCSLTKYDDAIEVCAEAVRQMPYEALAWAIKANALAAKGDHEAAIKDFNKAIELKPNSSVFWYNKGQSLRKQGHLLMAVHAFDKAIEFNRLSSNAWNQRGNALVDIGKYYHSEGQKSLMSYITSINIYSNDGVLWLNNSCAKFKQVNYYFGEALRSYEMAIDINPNDGMFWSNKGNMLKLFGRIDEADAAIARGKELGYNG